MEEPVAEAGEPLELDLGAFAPEAEAEDAAAEVPAAPQGSDDASSDELLLDAAEEDAASPLVQRKRPLVAPEAPTPRLSGGGTTLFERMANLSRGGGRSLREEDEGESEGEGQSISIPRFLGRQNNQ
jgi:cell division protein FtsZ